MMNLLISCYVGGCIVGFMNIKDIFSIETAASTLVWPLTASVWLINLVATNMSKLTDIIGNIVTVVKTVVTWITNLFKKAA